jgi:hypothetical protein
MLKEIVSPDASFVALPQAEKTEGEALFGQSFKGSLVPTKVFLDISIHSPIHSCLLDIQHGQVDRHFCSDCSGYDTCGLYVETSFHHCGRHNSAIWHRGQIAIPSFITEFVFHSIMQCHTFHTWIFGIAPVSTG